MRLLAALALLLSCATPARASVARSMELAELVRGADVVLHGTVLRATSAWEDGRIVTRSTVSVLRPLKGPMGAEVVVLTLGGVVGDIGQVASGEAALPPGGEVVLFLEVAGGGLRPLGMSQGAFHVGTDPATGARVAARRLDGLGLARPSAGGLQVSPAGPEAPVPLDDLLARIAALAGPPPAPRQR